VPRRWRIRHKFSLGLTLVVGIMALLLLGTLQGLGSYRATTKSIDSKLSELKAVQELREAIAELHLAAEGQNIRDLEARLAVALERLETYRELLRATLLHKRDLDRGQDEKPLVHDLTEQLQALRDLVRRDLPATGSSFVPQRLSGDEAVLERLQRLQLTVDTLRDHIDSDLRRRIAIAKDDYRFSLVLVCCLTAAGALLTVGLALLAYRWIVGPIRDLHAKVARLAEADFSSKIEIHSNDEMQDLAAAFNDMTERLHRIYSDLARQVNERSRQLVRSERLAGIGFLAAGVAHEINNPLASIAFCSEALERRLQELLHDRLDHPDYPTVQNYLKMIQEEAFRCKGITQKLLEFSRVGEKRRQSTSLADLIRSVLDMLAHHQSYRDKQIELQVRKEVVALVNAEEIKSVILNLVVNGLESMDAGGKLRIELDVEDGMAVMRFEDNGCGMTPEVLENLFEPFFTRSRTGRGIGLGLSISHRIVTQHGGEIEASSPGPDQGSVFVVRLPLRPVQSQEVSERRAA
jgi:two-component system NtrC family sensor kinase